MRLLLLQTAGPKRTYFSVPTCLARCASSTARLMESTSNPASYRGRHWRSLATRATQVSALERQMRQPVLPPVEARKQLQSMLPVELFRIAGVTFEERQAAVAALKQDQAVMLVKEPDNPHDPAAIHVKALCGQSLGYVPRELTARFPHPVTFGHVASIGRVTHTDLYGAQVAVQPTLPPLTVDAVPESLAANVNLSSSLPEEDWDRLRRAAYRAANYSCEVSGGAGAEWPVECHERWSYDKTGGVVRLEGLQALAPALHAAMHAARARDERRRGAAVWTLQAMNNWTVTEAECYLQHVKALIKQRSAATWLLDLRWLELQGVLIPDVLRPLCAHP